VDVLPASGLVRMDAHPLEVLLAIQGPAVPSMCAPLRFEPVCDVPPELLTNRPLT
jgi:hypothetical protein